MKAFKDREREWLGQDVFEKIINQIVKGGEDLTWPDVLLNVYKDVSV